MLSRQYRLTGKGNYKRVQDKGNVFQSNNFGVAIYNREDTDPTRFGFVVSTKIASAAVDRNLARRKLSEGVRTSIVDVKNGFDVAFLAKPSITRTPTANIMSEV
ncbi:MAG: ribonuclease P protein component, partial [Microgenomates group bacterium]